MEGVRDWREVRQRQRPLLTTTQGNTGMDTDTRTRIECTNWDEAGGPRSCVAVEFHAETKGGRTRRSASLPRGRNGKGGRAGARPSRRRDGGRADAMGRVPPYVGGSSSLRWGFDLPTFGKGIFPLRVQGGGKGNKGRRKRK